jgi:monoamine oxidase
MGRSPLFSSLQSIIQSASESDRSGASPPEHSRRKVLQGMGGIAMAAAAAGAGFRPRSSQPRIAILGGGLAGLAAADRLRQRGYSATIYEASNRVGGRCKSLRGFFPGQVAEMGGEFIDTGHKTMINYAREFGLTLEDVNKEPGEPRYFFGGETYGDAEVVAQYRELSRNMQRDFRLCSGAPTFFAHNQTDIELDNIDLESYLATRGAGLPLIQAVMKEAYLAEYGLEAHQQSCLNFLLFAKVSQRSKFQPFGVFSDERFHVVEGNDAIASGIAARLPGQTLHGRRLTSLEKNSAGEFELRFAGFGQTFKADLVICTIPFRILRELDLAPSLGLSSDKLRAINEVGFGLNAKTMVGFNGRPWLENQHSNGAGYADLTEVQTTWQTNPSRAGATSILTDYAGGDRAGQLGARPIQNQVSAWLNELDLLFPGSEAAATLNGNSFVAAREDWPSNPLVKGGYTCYLPGQFTTIAGLEGQPAGALKFAGEHTDSFYSYQGFMEGACLSGIRAANEVMADL